MRTSTRRLAAVLAAVATLFALSAPQAQAATAISGSLLLHGTDPAKNTTVELWTNVGGVPGALYGSDETNNAGLFSIDTTAAAPTDTFFVKVIGSAKAVGGWVGGGAVQFDLTYAETFAPDTALGELWATPSWIKARVVDRSGHGVGGVTVTLRDVLDPTTVRFTATTKPNGRFEFEGLDYEEYYAFVDGSAEGYESGYVGCLGEVYPTTGEACSVGTGNWSVNAVLDELP